MGANAWIAEMSASLCLCSRSEQACVPQAVPAAVPRPKTAWAYVPYMFFGTIEINDLHRPWKVLGGQIPYPWRTVAHDHYQASLAPARIAAPDGKATSQSCPWRCGAPHSAHCLALAYPHRRKAAISDRLGPRSARNTAPVLISRDTSPLRCSSSFSIGPVASAPVRHQVRCTTVRSPSAAAPPV